MRTCKLRIDGASRPATVTRSCVCARSQAASIRPAYGPRHATRRTPSRCARCWISHPNCSSTLRIARSRGSSTTPLRRYDELDLRLAWSAMEKLDIASVGQNLLHDQHAEFNPLVARREIEQSVYGKVT